MRKKIFFCIVFIVILFCAGCNSESEVTNNYFESEEYASYIDELNQFGVVAPEGFTIDTDDSDGFIYIYEGEKSIPCIMLKRYGYEGNLSSFESEYIVSLKENYSQNSFVMDSRMNNNIGGKKVRVLESSYKLEEYTVTDMRCILESEDCFFVFTLKEVPALNHNLASEFDFILKNFVVF